MMRGALTIGLLTLAPAAQQPDIAGDLPLGVEAPSQIAWLAADLAENIEGRSKGPCTTVADRRWTCRGVSAGASGVVVLIAGNAIGYVVLGREGVIDTGRASWGRLVLITPDVVAQNDLHDLQVSAWKVERPAVRPQSVRLVAVPDSALRVRQVSETAFWIAGFSLADDSFLKVEGPGIASHDVRAQLLEGPADQPLLIAPANPSSITGRVEARPGEPAFGVAVELFASLSKTVTIRRAETRTDADGWFEFSHLETAGYEIVAKDSALGRGQESAAAGAPPVLIRLVPPATATGRVFQRGLPAPMVRVRFVPDASAWSASTDPSMHITVDSYTDNMGRFSVPLPSVAVGTLQFMASDGASVRIALSAPSKVNQIHIGDVALPGLTTLVVRLLDRVDCDLSAVGPLGSLGLTIVQSTRASDEYWFDLPETGTWVLNARCRDRNYRLEPGMVTITRDRYLPPVDVHLVVPETR